MKICAIICEYNPFHNGHLYQMQQAKRLSGADAILCLMSGNFVQRGEAAIVNKFTRAKHAVLAGADAVIELPTPFATANAELFAKGAVKILSAIPSVETLCFGAETADSGLFIDAAKKLNNEPPHISAKIKELTATGISYAKARARAWTSEIDDSLLSSPNNILGIEYTRAILSTCSSIQILPVTRVGGKYNDEALYENFSSATAIRNAIENNSNFENNVPDFVAKDLPKEIKNCLETLEKYALISTSAEEIANVCDCTEGLENALRRAAEGNLPLTETLTSARYTTSRIRRIALQNLLKIDEKLIRNSLQAPLYLRVLAVKDERKEILTALSESNFPVIARPRDADTLSQESNPCYQADLFAEKIYNLLYPSQKEEKINIFIK